MQCFRVELQDNAGTGVQSCALLMQLIWAWHFCCIKWVVAFTGTGQGGGTGGGNKGQNINFPILIYTFWPISSSLFPVTEEISDILLYKGIIHIFLELCLHST